MSTDPQSCPICGKPYPNGAWPFCQDETGRHGHTLPHGGTLLASIHPLERTTIYRNPRTGETKIPARNDMPMPATYAREGYVREELTTIQSVKKFEKDTGRLHERSHYDNGSATAERDLALPEVKPKRDRELHHKLVQELRK